MERFLKHYRLSENIEVLLMLTLGIVLQTTDGSPFSIKKRWMTVWETELPPEHFSQFVQHCIKMILSSIVVIRCSTTYVYVMSAMLVMFCIVKDSFPRVMLFWLLIASIKSVLLTFIEALTGVYVCSAFGNIRKACLEFFISKALELIFAAYLWGSVLKIYQEMIRKEANRKKRDNLVESRPRARSLLDESTLQKTARLNSFEFKDVPQIILQMLRREEEMSRDSLLGSGMMLASVSNFGSFEDLKTSQSLGELGLLDLKGITVMGMEEDDQLSPQERALKFLKMTSNDVRKAQETRETILGPDVFQVDEEIWNRITGSHPILKKPKQTRPEVVLQQFPLPDLEPEVQLLKKESHKKSIELKFGFSLFSFIREKDELHSRDDEQLSGIETLEEDGDDEGEEDSFSSPLFMSNIREEVAVNRIRLDFVSRKFKGNAYAKLYKEDYMSIIGPEVFDRATRLPKVTVPVSSRIEARASMSLPSFMESARRGPKKINFGTEADEKVEKSESSADSPLTPHNSEDVRAVNNYHLDDISRCRSTFDEKPLKVDSTTTHDGSLHRLEEDFFLQEGVQMHSEWSLNVVADKNRIAKNLSNSKEPRIIDQKDIAPESQIEIDDSKPGKFVQIPRCDSPHVMLEPDREENKEECGMDREKESQEPQICHQRRRIKIRRVRTRQQMIQSDLKHSEDDPENHESDSDFSPSANRTLNENPCKPESQVLNSRQSFRPRNDFFRASRLKCKESDQKGCIIRGEINEDKQTHVVTRLLQQPFLDLFTAYYTSGSTSSKTEQTNSINPFDRDKRSKIKRNLCDSTSNKNKKGRIWKSQVLKKVAPHKVASANERTFCFFDNPIYVNLLSNLVTKRLLLAKYSVTSTTSGSKEIAECDHRQSSVCKPDSGNSSLKINTHHTYSVSRKSLNLALSPTSTPLTVPETPHREASDSQVVEKWVNAAFTGADSGCNDKRGTTSSDVRIQKEEDSTDETDSIFSKFPRPVVFEPVTSEEDSPPCARESDESFSLYYSKTADLASPLLDMKRFIYPDHIHYSYKHVNKKGFDVNINAGLPLLVRESLTISNPIGVRQTTSEEDSDLKIVCRPMDLSFASTYSWQNTNPTEAGIKFETVTPTESKAQGGTRGVERAQEFKKLRKLKKNKRPTYQNQKADVKWKNFECEKHQKRFNDLLNFMEEDVVLVEKLVKIYKRFSSNRRSCPQEETTDTSAEDRLPVQISSTQLHSNKGKVITSNYNPALVLNENKIRHEKKKMETQEERTKDMFARLEREVLLQSKNHQKNFTSSKNS